MREADKTGAVEVARSLHELGFTVLATRGTGAVCAEAGVAVIVVSSDLPELTRLADRIIVLRKGRVIKEFAGGGVTEVARPVAAGDLLFGKHLLLRKGKRTYAVLSAV